VTLQHNWATIKYFSRSLLENVYKGLSVSSQQQLQNLIKGVQYELQVLDHLLARPETTKAWLWRSCPEDDNMDGTTSCKAQEHYC